MLEYLSADIISCKKRTVFRERSSRKTVSYEEQIMSKDKYPSIFSTQMEATVFVTLQIYFATRAGLKIGMFSRDIFQLYLGNIRSRDVFAPIARQQKYFMHHKALCYISQLKYVFRLVENVSGVVGQNSLTP